MDKITQENIKDKQLYNSRKNVKAMEEDPRYHHIENFLAILSKMMNIHGSVPKHVKTMISEETSLSVKDVRNFIVRHREEIKKYPYVFDKSPVKTMPGEKNYKA